MNSAHSCISELLVFPCLMSTLFPLPAPWNFCVCTDKANEWSVAPERTEIFPSAGGSCSAEQPETEKGDSVKSWMTSPTFFLQNSWETLGSANHLSKPDVREIAEAYPRIPAGAHRTSGVSQAAEVDVGCPAGEEWNTFHQHRSGVLPLVFTSLYRKTWRRHWPHQQQVMKKLSLELFSVLIPMYQWRQPRADTRELLEAAQSSFDVPAAAPCFDVSTNLCVYQNLLLWWHFTASLVPSAPWFLPCTPQEVFEFINVFRAAAHKWKPLWFVKRCFIFQTGCTFPLLFLLVARCSGGFIYRTPSGAAVWTVIPCAGWCQLVINGSHCCFRRKQWQPRGTICCSPQECKNNMSLLFTANEDKPLEQALLGEKRMLFP